MPVRQHHHRARPVQPHKPSTLAQPHLRAGGVLELQRLIGNQAVQRLFRAVEVQQHVAQQIQRKKFTQDEFQWISEVWDLPEVRLLFQAYDDIPDPILHRVESLSGSEGQTSGVDISIADRTYESREYFTDDKGKPVKATDPQEFKATLLHEMLHFFFNQTQHIDPKKAMTPKVLQGVMLNPQAAGLGRYAFGWFQHPESDLILHFDVSATGSELTPEAYVDPETPLGKIKSSGAYEHSPMPQSGEHVSPEEDLAAVMSLYLTSQESRNTLMTQYPLRYQLMAGYFENVLPSMVDAKKKAGAG